MVVFVSFVCVDRAFDVYVVYVWCCFVPFFVCCVSLWCWFVNVFVIVLVLFCFRVLVSCWGVFDLMCLLCLRLHVVAV